MARKVSGAPSRPGAGVHRSHLRLLSSSARAKVYRTYLSRYGAHVLPRHPPGHRLVIAGEVRSRFMCRRIDRAAMQGLPVAELNPYQIEEKPGIGTGSGALALMNRHPHPNSARVFINWFLSLEGQIAFRQANTDELRVGSLREDLPQELLPPLAKRRKDKEYLWINRPDWMDFTPIQNLLEELRKGK